jgi:hypothetical protein
MQMLVPNCHLLSKGGMLEGGQTRAGRSLSTGDYSGLGSLPALLERSAIPAKTQVDDAARVSAI